MVTVRGRAQAAGVDAGSVVPPPFVVDQGALYLLDADFSTAVDAADLLHGLALAVEGGLHIPRATFERLAALAPGLKGVAPERRAPLVLRLLDGEQPASKLDAALRAGLAQRLLPEIERLRSMPKGNGLYKDVYVHTLRVVDGTPDDVITRLAALLHDISKPDTLVVEDGSARFPNHDLLGAERAARRLRSLGFGPEVVSAVATLVRLHLRANSYEATWTDSAVRRLHLDAGDQWERLLALSYADVTSARPDVVARAHRRVRELEEHARSLDRAVEVSPLDGKLLMQHFNRGPGRWIGEVKQHLLELVRAGALAADDADAAWAAAERFVGEPGRPPVGD